MSASTGKTFVIVADPEKRAQACALMGGVSILHPDTPIATHTDYLVLAVGDPDPVGFSAKRVLLMPGWKGTTPEMEAAAWDWYARCVRGRWYDRNPAAHTVIAL